MQTQNRPEWEIRSEWVQDSAKQSLGDAEIHICSDLCLHHPELQGATGSPCCMDASVVAPNTASPVATRQGDLWHSLVWFSSALEKHCACLGNFPTSSLQRSRPRAAWLGLDTFAGTLWVMLALSKCLAQCSQRAQHPACRARCAQDVKPQKLLCEILFLGYISLNSFH